MTIDQQQMLEREMRDALLIEDKERREDAVQTVTLHYLSALCDCQRKTAERVKELVAERDMAKAKLEGAQILWKVLRFIATFGGGAGALYVLKALTGGAV